MCREFVEMHGSSINATNEIGKGTCFSFALKLSSPAN
ncbi:MAG: hypothetical protein HKM87_06440 [Ignavibacteriaceae bacterium]|nr:hypothetical protein [Ignavibacteriaceae bacterium]